MAGASTEEENAASATAAKEDYELRWNELEWRTEAAAADLKRLIEAAVEVAKIAERGVKGAAEESEVKAATAKAAADSLSSAGTSSADNSVSTATSTSTRAPTSTSSVVGVARRSGYILIIMML